MSQREIEDFVESPNSVFGDAQDIVGRFFGAVRNRLEDTLGIDLDWLSQNPREADLSPDSELYVYQFVVAYSGGKMQEGYPWSVDGDAAGGASVRSGSASPEVQFKTGVYVVGEPEQELETRLSEVDNPRLQTLFNTEEYAGYMDGFGFTERETYIQREEVSAREVEQKGYGLGTPWFEVEAYDDDGELAGYADGYLNPYSRETVEETTTTGSPIPQEEVWKVGSRQAHSSGSRYQISPESRSGAKNRAKEIAGKTVYLNGFAIGSVLSGGRARLKVEYTNPSRATYSSRKQIIENSGTPYQALSEGANAYKVKEDEENVYLSTTKPESFDATDPEMVDPDGVGIETETTEVTYLFADDSEPTRFRVETDEKVTRLMGLYDPIRVRDISRGTNLRAGSS